MGGRVEVPLVIFLDADNDTMIERITHRSGTSNRNDDNIEVLRLRLDTYKEATMPIIEEYANRGKVAKINALQSVEKVYEEVKSALKDYL